MIVCSRTILDETYLKMETAASSGDASAFVEALIASLEASSVVVDLTATSEGDAPEYGDPLVRAKDLLSSSLRIVGQKITQQAKDVVDGASKAADNFTFLKLVDVSFLEPRGRFTASFSSNGLLLEGKSANCFVPWENVSHAASLPSSTSTKKEGEDLLALRVSPAVKCSGKDLGGILLSLNKCLGTPIKVMMPTVAAAGGAPDSPPPHTLEEGIAAAMVPKLVQMLWKNKVVIPRKDIFQSVSLGPGGQTKPYLRCHKGVNEGAIYLISSGVVFVKPLLFLPAEGIASLSAGRGGGSGQTRYVDLKIEMADDSEYEFVNIEREELPALQNYVKGYLEERAKEEAERKLKIKRESGEGGDEADDDSDDEDDDDWDEDDEEDDDGSDDDSDDSGNSDGEVDDDDDDSSKGSAKKTKAKAKAKDKEKSKGKDKDKAKDKTKTKNKDVPTTKTGSKSPKSRSSASKSDKQQLPAAGACSSMNVVDISENEAKEDEAEDIKENFRPPLPEEGDTGLGWGGVLSSSGSGSGLDDPPAKRARVDEVSEA